MILSLFRKDPFRDTAIALYEQIVEQSRKPAFYAVAKAPDTVEGRFEIVAVHVYLVLRQLKSGGDRAKKLSQALFDVFFQNMDDSLRELGVGDLSVGKKIRALGEAFYGRVGAYETGLDENDADALAAAIARNVFEVEMDPGAQRIAAYLVEADSALANAPLEELMKGVVQFPEPVLDRAA